MERLTERFANGQAAVLGCGNNCKYDFKYCHNHLEDCPAINEIYERLVQYEDLGVTPEQIREIDRLYREKCEEVAEHEKSSLDVIEICKINIALDRLKEYRQLEEQGLLLRLPCKVGDTVYAHCSSFGILPYVVDNIVIGEEITYQCSSYSEPIGDCPSECLDEIELDITDFGKTAFLTREEAEHALAEMKGV